MEYHAVVWRIFGAGHSPFKKRSTYELIEPVVSRRVPDSERGRAIAEISSWFTGDRKDLIPESEETVAATILQGVGTIVGQGPSADEAKIAAWAVGSIDAQRAARIIESSWSANQIDSLVDIALRELERLIEREEIFDPHRCALYLGTDDRTKMTVDVERLGGEMDAFEYLDSRGLSLVYCVRDEASNLIRVVLAIRPGRFRAMIERLDHPVLQACVAHHAVNEGGEVDYGRPISWIKRKSCAALVALAIVHTLKAVNQADASSRGEETVDADRRSGTAGVASRLITGLVERLGLLGSIDRVRWIAELLRTAPYVLHQRNDNGMPYGVSQLETSCIAQVARTVEEAWSDDLLNAFSGGLRSDRQRTWPRHIARLAWEIRDTMPGRSSEIARAALKEYEGHVADHMSRRRSLYLNWNDWEHREWMRCLGVALALSRTDMKLPVWVRRKFKDLPLSVWDAEEDYESFHSAATVAKHWFLIAFLSIPALHGMGRMVTPADVLELADCLWIHEEFITKYNRYIREDDIVGEHAARCAVEFGDPGGTWLLDCVGRRGVTPRALWALIDQRLCKSRRESKIGDKHDAVLTAEIRSIASERFGDGGEYGVDDLVFWGRLWILLEAADEAERTAVAMMTLPVRKPGRSEKLALLRLMAFVVSKRRSRDDVEYHARRLYRELWPGPYTLNEEREERNLIDSLLSWTGAGRR